MSTPNPNPEENSPDSLEQALRRDAGRIQPADFDAALHQEGMVRIRGLAERKSTGFSLRALFEIPLRVPMAGVAFALLLVALFFAFHRTPQPQLSPHVAVVQFHPAKPPVASVWSYQAALSRDDSALAELLDHDAQALLPPTPSVIAGFL